jgi:hypothetical protein
MPLSSRLRCSSGAQRGGSVSKGVSTTAAKGKQTGYGGIGPRLGLEIVLAGGHWVVSVEGDLVHPLGDTEQYFGEHGRWVPWGGGSVVEFF